MCVCARARVRACVRVCVSPDLEGEGVEQHADAGAVADLAGRVGPAAGDAGEEALAADRAVELEAERVRREPRPQLPHAARGVLFFITIIYNLIIIDSRRRGCGGTHVPSSRTLVAVK